MIVHRLCPVRRGVCVGVQQEEPVAGCRLDAPAQLAATPRRAFDQVRAELAGLPRLQTELDEEASVVLGASERMNALLMTLTPMEELLAPEGPNSPAATRNILQTYVSTEDARRALLARTFFLTYLYGSELRATRERLQIVGEHIREYVGP